MPFCPRAAKLLSKTLLDGYATLAGMSRYLSGDPVGWGHGHWARHDLLPLLYK